MKYNDLMTIKNNLFKIMENISDPTKFIDRR